MPRRKLENRTIEVILLQHNKHLGEKYEVVRVKPIFARNVLLPKEIAVLATKANLHKFEQKMKVAEQDSKNRANSFDELFSKIQSDGGLSIVRKANKDDVLYAQITTDEISALIKEKYSIDVDEHLFKIKKKIKTTGEYTVPFLYKELKKELILVVKAEANKEKAKDESKAEEEVKEEVVKTK